MVARTQLAALDPNANTGRQQATVSRGENEGGTELQGRVPKANEGMGCKTYHGEANKRTLKTHTLFNSGKEVARCC